MIVWVNVVLNRTVVVDSDWRFDNLRGSHLQSQSELYHVSWWYYTLVIDLIGQLRRDVIGRLSVKPWRYWLWRLLMSLVRFDPSIVTVKQSFIVSQIVSCPVVLSSFVSLDSVVFTVPVTFDFDSENDFRKGCRNVRHCQQQQSYSALRSPGRSYSTCFNMKWLLGSNLSLNLKSKRLESDVALCKSPFFPVFFLYSLRWQGQT